MNAPINVESDFTYKGYRCLVTIHPSGWRCGYIEVKQSHPLYGKNYNDEIIDIYVHGGLTFSGHVIESDGWWFGFDAGHGEDGIDLTIVPREVKNVIQDGKVTHWSQYEAAKKLKKVFRGAVKNKEYMESECRSLIDQL